MSLCKDTRRILELCKNNIRQLKPVDKDVQQDFASMSMKDFNVDGFWIKLNSGAQILSQEVTKFCVAFTNVANAEGYQELCSALEMAAGFLTRTSDELPLSYGQCLHTTVEKVVFASVASVADLLDQFLAVETSQQRYLILTGYTWEHCEKIKLLPKDNKEAVLRLVQSEFELVNDANDELNSAVDGDEMEWSASELVLLSSCVGLVKTAKACMKKTQQAVQNKGSSSNVASVIELDKLRSIFVCVSEVVDDFVLTLYPPIDRSAVNDASNGLSSCLVNLLDCVRCTHLSNAAEDQQWIEFLNNAVKHNHHKIQIMTDQNRNG